MSTPADLDQRRRTDLAIDLERIAGELDAMRWPYSAARLREAAALLRPDLEDTP